MTARRANGAAARKGRGGGGASRAGREVPAAGAGTGSVASAPHIVTKRSPRVSAAPFFLGRRPAAR